MRALLVTSMALLLAAADPLEAARAHLAAGETDALLTLLDEGAVTEEHRPQAAALLARAGLENLQADDFVLALHFAQTALRQAEGEPLALQVAARACFALQQFSPAEEYADRWLAASAEAPAARLLRAELALAQGEWDRALALLEGIPSAKLAPAEAMRVRQITEEARRERSARKEGYSALASLEGRLKAARTRGTPPAGMAHGGVVLYGTRWCQYCRQAAGWLRARNVPFVEKDLERDPMAAAELAMKALAAGVPIQGVPVIDVRGRLVVGFDPPRLESLLK